MSTLNLNALKDVDSNDDIAPEGKPLYRHDCSRCHFLGSVDNADLYACIGASEQTVIARYSDEGANYSSGLYFAYGANPLLTEARMRAQKRDLLAYDLDMALAYVATIPEGNPSAQELLERLMETRTFDVLRAMPSDMAKGTKALHALLQPMVAAELREDDTLLVDNAVDNVCRRINQAWNWMRHFKQDVPARTEFMLALYSYQHPGREG